MGQSKNQVQLNEAISLFQLMLKQSCKQYIKELDKVTIADAAFYFDVSVQTIRKNKKLHYTSFHGTRYYYISEIEAFINSPKSSSIFN